MPVIPRPLVSLGFCWKDCWTCVWIWDKEGNGSRTWMPPEKQRKKKWFRAPWREKQDIEEHWQSKWRGDSKRATHNVTIVFFCPKMAYLQATSGLWSLWLPIFCSPGSSLCTSWPCSWAGTANSLGWSWGLKTLSCVGRVAGRKMWFVQGILKLLKNENSMEELGKGQVTFVNKVWGTLECYHRPSHADSTWWPGKKVRRWTKSGVTERLNAWIHPAGSWEEVCWLEETFSSMRSLVYHICPVVGPICVSSQGCRKAGKSQGRRYMSWTGMQSRQGCRGCWARGGTPLALLPVLGKPPKDQALPTPVLSHENIPNQITEEDAENTSQVLHL